MVNTIQRLLKHALAPRWQHYLSEAAMQRITAAVAACESRHSGEIRVCVEARLPTDYLLDPAPLDPVIRRRAVEQFSRLGVWDTEHNNGVLIYLLLAERRIEVVADRGIANRVSPSVWQRIVDELGAALKRRAFEEGVTEAVAAVSSLLQVHWANPPMGTNANELPDRPHTL